MRSLLLVFVFSLTGFSSYSQTVDTTGQNYFLTFVKKVYLNPTILLRTQQFREANNVRVMLLPDMNGQDDNTITGFERAFQKLIRFLIEGDDEGSVRLYFDVTDHDSPYTFVCSDELYCKFKPADIDSIERRLNTPFSGVSYNLNSHALFEASLNKGLQYIGQCLNNIPSECGDKPDYTTTTINTRPLSISVNNTSSSKFDIDRKQHEALESYYAKAYDVFTQQDWYAPSKFLVTGKTDELIAIGIHKHESLFKKQNFTFRLIYNDQVLPVESQSTNDTIFIKLPKDLPSGKPLEVTVNYKSPVDSINYTVGFFMVSAYAPKEFKLHLIGVNGANVSARKSAIEAELKKVYDPVGVTFVVDEATLLTDSDWPVNITIESSGIFSNYAEDMRDYVHAVQDLQDYEKDEYYLVFGLYAGGAKGYMPRARNIGFIFEELTEMPAAGIQVAHELGHGVFHLRHLFDEEELGETERGLTRNIMDYNLHPRELYLHQWMFINDPAFVSWFGGDDEDASLLEAVPFRCIPAYLTKTHDVESYYNTSGTVVQLNANQIPYAFVGSESEYKGRLLTVSSGGKFYYSAKDNITYPHYYAKKNANGIDVNGKLSLTQNQSLPVTEVLISEDCSYNIKHPNEPRKVGKIDSCDCSSNKPPSIGSDYDYAVKRLHYEGLVQYVGNPSAFSCDRFVLYTSEFGKFPGSVKSQIASFKLTSEGLMYSFTLSDGKEYINAVWGAKKKNTTDDFRFTGGSRMFICFDDIEDNIMGNGVTLIGDPYDYYYLGISTTADYVIKVADTDISPYEVDAIVITLNDNNQVACDKARMTLQILESSILDCHTSACFSKYYKYMSLETLKQFKKGTLNHILDHMFYPVQIEHPFAEEAYGYMTASNSENNYILFDIIEALADRGESKWFYESFLMNQNSVGIINLQKMVTGVNDVNFKILLSDKIFKYLNSPGVSRFVSPTFDLRDSRNNLIKFPANVNTVIPYYENWLQADNQFVVKGEKCNAAVVADEFDFHYYKGLLNISQSGVYRIIKNTGNNGSDYVYQSNDSSWVYRALTKMDEAGVDFEDYLQMETYNDNYKLHPYDFIEVVLGKAIPELNLKEGQKMRVPAFFVSVIGQFGKDKVSAQNFQIFVGVVAVASAVVTGGTSLAALSTTAGTMSLTTFSAEVFVLSLGVATTTLDIADLYFVATDGNENLTAAELKFRENVSRVAMYLNFVELGVGGFSALRKLTKMTNLVTTLADRLKKPMLSALKTEVDNLDVIFKAEFYDDFANTSEDFLKQLQDEDLLDVWKNDIRSSKLDDLRLYKSKGSLRSDYTAAVANLKNERDLLFSQNKTTEEVARILHQRRRDIGVQFKNATPDDMREWIYEFNMLRYEDKLGPKFDWLYNKGKAKGLSDEEVYESIIETSATPLGDKKKLGEAMRKTFKDNARYNELDNVLKKYRM